MRAVAFALLLPTLALPQSPAPHPEDLGTVTGHIVCADTQHPARLASVRLIPANPTQLKQEQRGINDPYGGMIPAVQTDLSGGYTVRNVQPGEYYLSVSLVGYVTPLTGFRRDQLTSPTPEIQQRMQRELTIVNVVPHSTITIDVTLHRGASISGTIAFDDGSPAPVALHVLRPNTSGEFQDQIPGTGYAQVDDHGHYRITGLPEGEYILEADLTLTSEDTSSIKMPDGHMMSTIMTRYLFKLPVYSGSVIRRNDATHLKLEAGQETSGIDITIPISTLHEITGSVQAKDGHTINGGKVALLFADDRSQFAQIDINNDDSTFQFPYVPEGNYILSVTNAKDVGHVEVPNAPGATPPTHTEHPTLHTYGSAEQPITVTTDLQSVSVIVPEKPSTAPSE